MLGRCHTGVSRTKNRTCSCQGAMQTARETCRPLPTAGRSRGALASTVGAMRAVSEHIGELERRMRAELRLDGRLHGLDPNLPSTLPRAGEVLQNVLPGRPAACWRRAALARHPQPHAHSPCSAGLGWRVECAAMQRLRFCHTWGLLAPGCRCLAAWWRGQPPGHAAVACSRSQAAKCSGNLTCRVAGLGVRCCPGLCRGACVRWPHEHAHDERRLWAPAPYDAAGARAGPWLRRPA